MSLEEASRYYSNLIQMEPDSGFAYYQRGHVSRALGDSDQAIQLRPVNGWSYAMRAYAWSAKGDRDTMMQDLNTAIEDSSEDSSVWSNRAWLLATSPNANQRDGKLAVAAPNTAMELPMAVATRGMELPMWSEFRVLDVLAAANAEAGDFEQAVKWQTKVVSMLPPTQPAEYESRLALYSESKPHHEQLPRSSRILMYSNRNSTVSGELRSMSEVLPCFFGRSKQHHAPRDGYYSRHARRDVIFKMGNGVMEREGEGRN